MDLFTYLTTDIPDSFTETLSIGNHHVDIVVAVVSVMGAVVVAPELVLGLYIAIFEVVASLKPIESQYRGICIWIEPF